MLTDRYTVHALDHAFHAVLLLLARLQGLTVSEATTPAEREAARALTRTPCIPEELAGIHRSYQAQARIFTVHHRGEVVGTMTVYVPDTHSRTLDSGPLRLPAGLSLDQVVDIGNLYIKRGYRGGARLVFLNLLAAGQRLSMAEQRPYWIGMTSPGLIRVYLKINATTEVLSVEPDERPEALRRYWEAYRVGQRIQPVPFALNSYASSAARVVSAHLVGLLRSRALLLGVLG